MAEPGFAPERILAVLREHGVRYVLVGGFAAVIHGSPYVTTDLDVVPERSEENLRRLSEALRAMHARVWTEREPRGIRFEHDAASLASAETYGQVRTVSAGVLLLQVLVAYPLTVLAEEAFFRGFLQPRLPWAPPVLSGVLWAVHHLQQASTIPSLVPLGVALGIIRWWTGDVRVSGLVHYAGDVAFFLSSYTVAERL